MMPATLLLGRLRIDLERRAYHLRGLDEESLRVSDLHALCRDQGVKTAMAAI